MSKGDTIRKGNAYDLREAASNHPLEYFREIARIPRKSGDETGIRQALTEFAKRRQLSWQEDEAGNLLIRKKGTKGKENGKTVILQAHMDMVFETEDAAKYPYHKGLQLEEYGDVISARGTSLGADNGLGIAMILSVLASDQLAHPPIEALFTAEEEDGLVGAMRLSADWLKGGYLLNLDGEEEQSVTAGCAGAFRSEITVPLSWEKSRESVYYKIKIQGLCGGHSGLDINKGRKNANQLMGRFLQRLKNGSDFRICELKGGTRMNAIPTSAEVTLAIKEQEQEVLRESFRLFQSEIEKDLVEEDRGWECVMTQTAWNELCWDLETTDRVCQILKQMPNGVLRMDRKIPQLVETSTNLGIMASNAEKACFISNTRSSDKRQLEQIKQDMRQLSTEMGADCRIDSEYPAWEYQETSALRDFYKEIYEEKQGKEMTIEVIHGGLECGVILDKYPGIDAISVGPEIKNVHSTSEEFLVSSLERVWEILQCVLERLG